jgi:hypothetical protein
MLVKELSGVWVPKKAGLTQIKGFSPRDSRFMRVKSEVRDQRRSTDKGVTIEE